MEDRAIPSDKNSPDTGLTNVTRDIPKNEEEEEEKREEEPSVPTIQPDGVSSRGLSQSANAAVPSTTNTSTATGPPLRPHSLPKRSVSWGIQPHSTAPPVHPTSSSTNATATATHATERLLEQLTLIHPFECEAETRLLAEMEANDPLELLIPPAAGASWTTSPHFSPSSTLAGDVVTIAGATSATSTSGGGILRHVPLAAEALWTEGDDPDASTSGYASGTPKPPLRSRAVSVDSSHHTNNTQSASMDNTMSKKKQFQHRRQPTRNAMEDHLDSLTDALEAIHVNALTEIVDPKLQEILWDSTNTSSTADSGKASIDTFNHHAALLYQRRQRKKTTATTTENGDEINQDYGDKMPDPSSVRSRDELSAATEPDTSSTIMARARWKKAILAHQVAATLAKVRNEDNKEAGDVIHDATGATHIDATTRLIDTETQPHETTFPTTTTTHTIPQDNDDMVKENDTTASAPNGIRSLRDTIVSKQRDREKPAMQVVNKVPLLRELVLFGATHQPTVVLYVKVIVCIILPSMITSCILFYFAGNPPTGRVDWVASSQNSTLINHNGNPIDPNQPSVSWMLLFLGVRQLITFSMAQATQLFIVDFVCIGRRWTKRLGSMITLLIVQV